ncbi:MAG: YbjN domain-containing protein [Rhodobiaceae bacterium]|nr:YbjN domain-containing protein [Rhodobiaceae bacterium]
MMRKMAIFLGLAVAVLIGPAPFPALAQDKAQAPEATAEPPIEASDPARIAQILQDFGYRALLEKDSQGDPVIRTTFSQVNSSIFFYSCTDGADCKVIQFAAGFDLKDGISLSKLNDWNRNKLFGAAYRDDEDDPWLKMTVNLEGGVTPQNLRHTIEWWQVIIDDFKEHIDF